MEQAISNLIGAFENGTLSRRQLVASLALTTTATIGAATIAASPANAAEPAKAGGGTIERLQVVPGLQRPQVKGVDAYSHVVSSNRRRMVFIAGQLARDAQGKTVGVGDIRAQMRQVCENLKSAVTAAGGTLADIVQTSIFVTNWDLFSQALDVRHEYFGQNLPTATAVVVAALSSPDSLIEINAIAMVDG